MVLIESDGLFFDKLKNLFDLNKEKGSVWVTLKRVEAKQRALDPHRELGDSLQRPKVTE